MKESAPKEEYKEEKAVDTSRRGFLKTIVAGAAAGAVGIGGSIAERKINKISESGSEVVEQNAVGINHQKYVEAINANDKETLESVTFLFKSYEDELISIRDKIAIWQNTIIQSKTGSGTRALAENTHYFYRQREEWLMGEIRTLRESLDAVIENRKNPSVNTPNSNMKGVEIDKNLNKGERGIMS
ncbi:MAG: twin-arginine translocation signal domain-containing protein [Patescibacteria group bacterium]